MNTVMKLKQQIDHCKRIVFFGGAGVSTESGIPDFRSADGLYRFKYSYSPEEILSHHFFVQHTKEFYDFYHDKMLYLDAKPNITHKKLAQLERQGKLTAVITQNIDGLHQKAGSKHVLELHGSVHRNKCQVCNKEYDALFIKNCNSIPLCTCSGIIKPDVVLYGESLEDNIVQAAITAIEEADMLIIGGTSLSVYPSAGYIQYFKGKYLVMINQTPTKLDKKADILLQENLGTVFSQL